MSVVIQEPKLSLEDARKICLQTIVNTSDFVCIQLVYGYAGKIATIASAQLLLINVHYHMTCHVTIR